MTMLRSGTTCTRAKPNLQEKTNPAFSASVISCVLNYKVIESLIVVQLGH